MRPLRGVPPAMRRLLRPVGTDRRPHRRDPPSVRRKGSGVGDWRECWEGTRPERRQRLAGTIRDQAGKGDEFAAFLEQGRALAAEEAGTVTWYAFKISDTTYGVFDTFNDEEGRQAHLNGRITEALGKVGPDLLASHPDIRQVDILAIK